MDLDYVIGGLPHTCVDRLAVELDHLDDDHVICGVLAVQELMLKLEEDAKKLPELQALLQPVA